MVSLSYGAHSALHPTLPILQNNDTARLCKLIWDRQQIEMTAEEKSEITIMESSVAPHADSQ